MSRSLAAKLPFVSFAERHVFVTVFGIIVPVLIFAGFIGYPIAYTITLSFFDWNGMTPSWKFVGLANYVQLFNDKYFYIALANNFRWLLVALVFPVTFDIVTGKNTAVRIRVGK